MPLLTVTLFCTRGVSKCQNGLKMAKALIFVPYLLLAVNAATQAGLRSMSTSDTQEILKEWGLHEEFGDSVRFCIVVSRHTKLPG